MSDDLSGLPPAQPDESGDLADHEAAFGPGGTGDVPESTAEVAETTAPAQTAEQKQAERDEQGRFQKTPRHRAKSQQASPADVPRIQELTAKLRAAEAERDALKARSAPSPTAPAALPPPAQVGPVSPERGRDSGHSQPWQPPPTRPKPSEDEVGTKYPTYADFTEDLSDWVGEQRDARREAKRAQEQQQQTYRDWGTSYQAKLADFRTKAPDYDQVIATANQQAQAAGLQVPQVMLDAIVSSERGPELEYWLATHQPEYHDLIREAWPVNQFASIGMVRRVLESRLPPVALGQRPTREAAGSTGAAPTLSVVPAPRPPTPVRTGPLKTGDDPPDDDASLDAHEAHYYRKSR